MARRIQLLVCLSLCAVLLAACGGSTDGPNSEAEGTAEQVKTPEGYGGFLVTNDPLNGLVPKGIVVEDGAILNVKVDLHTRLVNEELGIDITIPARESREVRVVPFSLGTYILACTEGCSPKSDTLTITIV